MGVGIHFDHLLLEAYMKLTNWGKYPVVEVNYKSFSAIPELRQFVLENKQMIARGLGRCYGDSSLSKNVTSILRFNRILSFDLITGEISCEAGISLKKLLDVLFQKVGLYL